VIRSLKRTSVIRSLMSANDPKRTWRSVRCSPQQHVRWRWRHQNRMAKTCIADYTAQIAARKVSPSQSVDAALLDGAVTVGAVALCKKGLRLSSFTSCLLAVSGEDWHRDHAVRLSTHLQQRDGRALFPGPFEGD